MPTQLLYLDDTYALTGEGIVTATGRDERGGYVILDRTVLYPQGGGQPADQGHLTIDGRELPLSFVGFQDGDVRHYLAEGDWAEYLTGKTARQQVDQTARMRHAKLHSAAHLVSHVLETIDPGLIPVKGYSFPDGSSVEFQSEQLVDLTPLLDRANADLAKDIAAGVKVTATLSDYPTITHLRPVLGPFTPHDKPTRIVAIGDYVPVPCGGTHVRDLSELGGVTITKFKKQKGNLRVSYAVNE